MSTRPSGGNIHPLTRSLYREAKTVHEDYDLSEIKHLRVLLRRLRFLETQLMVPEEDFTGGRDFVVRERDALIFTLTDAEYLEIHRPNESEKHA